MTDKQLIKCAFAAKICFIRNSWRTIEIIVDEYSDYNSSICLQNWAARIKANLGAENRIARFRFGIIAAP